MYLAQRTKEWREFKDWCVQRKLRALPVHAWTLSAYLLWLEDNRRFRSMDKRLDIIARAHLERCHHCPDQDDLVKRTRQSIEDKRLKPAKTIFKGDDLIKPAKKTPSDMIKNSKRTMRNQPSLVSRRPNSEKS
jgi:hypothetical protein